MDDLAAFLRARYDETAAKARAAAEELGADWYYDDGFVLARREGDMVATGSQDFLERERGEHIARHDPARVLAEVDAKRRAVAKCAKWLSYGPVGDMDVDRAGDGAYVDAAETMLRLLALPYADHEAYREDWRP